MSNWRFPPTPSFVASKYLKYGFVYDTAFKPGERYRSKKDMEQAVRTTIPLLSKVPQSR
jgi:hypothetical protein